MGAEIEFYLEEEDGAGANVALDKRPAYSVCPEGALTSSIYRRRIHRFEPLAMLTRSQSFLIRMVILLNSLLPLAAELPMLAVWRVSAAVDRKRVSLAVA
jgi:hypothetical protein